MHADAAAWNFGVEAGEHNGDGEEDEKCYDGDYSVGADQVLITVHLLEAVTHAYSF